MNRFRKLLAGLTPAVAGTMILALAGAGMPVAAQEVREPAAGPSALRQSIDRAVEGAAAKAPQDVQAPAALSADERADLLQRAGRLRSDPVAGEASGGGKGKMILTVLGLAVGAVTTYYTIQWVKKQQEEAQAGFRP